METINEIQAEIDSQKEQMEIYIIRREKYGAEGNEFAYGLMNDCLAKVLAKIDALKWALSDS